MMLSCCFASDKSNNGLLSLQNWTRILTRYRPMFAKLQITRRILLSYFVSSNKAVVEFAVTNTHVFVHFKGNSKNSYVIHDIR
jgi:hypothetical protein